MSQFVNYGKRDVSLPDGCKDLMDLLRSYKAGPHETADLKVRREWTERKPLRTTNLQIEQIYQSAASVALLTITSPQQQVSFCLSRIFDTTWDASFLVCEGTSEEEELRRLLTQQGFSLPERSPNPQQFVTGVPVQINYSLSPIPPQPDALSSLIIAFFRHVNGSEDESEFEFRFIELV